MRMTETKMDVFIKKELDALRKKINTYKTLLECYEIRLHLIDDNKANKSEYEKNEDEITKIITCSKIDSLKDKVFELEEQFNSLLR
jgi:hypothetical protein